MAVLAEKRLAALATHTYLGIAATVHEHNRLVTIRNALHKCIAQIGRHKYSLLLAHLPHVNNLHIRKACRRRSLLQFQVLQLMRAGIVIRF